MWIIPIYCDLRDHCSRRKYGTVDFSEVFVLLLMNLQIMLYRRRFYLICVLFGYSGVRKYGGFV